jgi:hypothetical protein
MNFSCKARVEWKDTRGSGGFLAVMCFSFRGRD